MRKTIILWGAAAASVLAAAFLFSRPSGPPPSPDTPPRPAGDPVPARPVQAMRYVYSAPESANDARYDYHWSLLRAALEKTVAKYGPYALEPSSDAMNEMRQFHELELATGRISVLVRGANADYEKALLPVRVPVDKGLLGYRVFLIRKQDQALFGPGTTLEDLKKHPIGQGSGWKDIDILRANGLSVVAGGEYEGLFPMLAHGRFDLFSRGVGEVGGEYATWKKKFPDLAIEDNLLLYYPIYRCFWFSKEGDGPRLAERVREGLMAMVADGSFDRMFMEHHRPVIQALGLGKRKLFVLENPHLPPGTPTEDKRLWYDPTKGE